MMRVAYKCAVINDACVLKPLFSAFERLRLDIKGVNVTTFSYRLGKKKSVVSVTHRKIGAGVARTEVSSNKSLLQFEYIKHNRSLSKKPR